MTKFADLVRFTEKTLMGNFSFCAAIETVDANIALEVNDSIQDCSNSIDFAVTYSDSINIT